MSRLTFALNCYAPESGANVAVLSFWDDGKVRLHGPEKSFARAALQTIGDRLGELFEITGDVPAPPKAKRRE